MLAGAFPGYGGSLNVLLMMNENYETVCLCALNTLFGYEPRVGAALLESLGSGSAVFGMTEREKDELFGPFSKYRGKLCNEALDSAEEHLRLVRECGAEFIPVSSPSYPARLKNCEDAPLGIFVRGSSVLEEIFGAVHYVAVVGTRDISPYGEQWCRDMVWEMAGSGVRPVIVSGLAYGTDIIAHRTALECGLATIAVMATGIDSVYPSRHRDFAEKLSGTEGCALVSDYPPGTSPVALNFLRRNRIIAGLSDCTILVESDIRGGGMVTCRQAFSYDRSVFALPGRGDDRRSRGCNHLIREGVAEIIESVAGLNVQIGLVEKGRQGSRRGGPSGDGPVPGGCSGGNGGADSCRTGASAGQTEAAMRERYSKLLPGEKLSAMTSILLTIREKRGVDFDGLCAATGLPYRNVSELVSLLENDGFITVDLLRRCSISSR